MKNSFIRRAAFVLALAFIAAPAVAGATTAVSSQPVHVEYSTSMSPLIGFGYPWTGRLQLTLNPDNIISGYYRPADNNEYVPVTGGRNGDNVWLDIGTSGRIHVTGKLQNGVINGTAYDQRSHDAYKFSATVGK